MRELKVSPFVAHGLLFIVNFIYGANFSIAKSVMPRFIGPFGFIFYRVFISLFLYGILYFSFFYEKVDKKDYGRIFICGLFGIALNQLLFFKGISLTSSVHGALLMITSPIITYILSHTLSREEWKPTKVLGIILGALGAGALILSSYHEVGTANVLGDIFVALNAMAFSIYLLLVKPLMKKYQPFTIAFLCFLAGSIWVFIFGFSQAKEVHFEAIPTQFYFHFAFVILGATFIVYLFNIIAIKSVSATTVSSFIYLQPFFAILISLAFTEEQLTLYTILGGICIIFGLWLINRKK